MPSSVCVKYLLGQLSAETKKAILVCFQRWKKPDGKKVSEKTKKIKIGMNSRCLRCKDSRINRIQLFYTIITRIFEKYYTFLCNNSAYKHIIRPPVAPDDARPTPRWDSDFPEPALRQASRSLQWCRDSITGSVLDSGGMLGCACLPLPEVSLCLKIKRIPASPFFLQPMLREINSVSMPK